MAEDNGEVSVGELRSDVAEFYDQLSCGWEADRGDHLHLGFYDIPPPPDNLLDHTAATVRMVEEVLKFADIFDEKSKLPRRVVDVGCGMGGSSRYLAKKYGAHVEGITLSTWQVQRAIDLTAAEGLSDKVAFQVADALDQPFPDGHFDLVWAMESGEHMPDKEKELLDKLSRACYLPAWCSTADYVRMAQALSLQNIKTADWSENVAPFWSSVKNKLSPALRKSGWKPLKGEVPINLWVDGFKQKLVKYAVITAQTPA